jgi:hypothetical protein
MARVSDSASDLGCSGYCCILHIQGCGIYLKGLFLWWLERSVLTNGYRFLKYHFRLENIGMT